MNLNIAKCQKLQSLGFCGVHHLNSWFEQCREIECDPNSENGAMARAGRSNYANSRCCSNLR